MVLDPSNGSVLNRHDFKLSDESPGHFWLQGDHAVVITTAAQWTRPGKILAGKVGSEFRELKFPASMSAPTGQYLSIAFEPLSSTFAITHPDGELISFWNSKSLEFVKAFSFSARGICVPKPGFILANTSANRHATLIDTKTWRTTLLGGVVLGNGSHLSYYSAKVTKIFG